MLWELSCNLELVQGIRTRSYYYYMWLCACLYICLSRIHAVLQITWPLLDQLFTTARGKYLKTKNFALWFFLGSEDFWPVQKFQIRRRLSIVLCGGVKACSGRCIYIRICRQRRIYSRLQICITIHLDPSWNDVIVLVVLFLAERLALFQLPLPASSSLSANFCFVSVINRK